MAETRTTSGNDFDFIEAMQASVAKAAPKSRPGREFTRLTPFVIPAPVVEPTNFYEPKTINGQKADPTPPHPSTVLGAYGAAQKAAHSEGTYQEKAAAARKAAAPKPEPAASRWRSRALSWDEYNALSDDQRAAVDFNTMLVQAREKDLSADYDATPGQRAQYGQAMERMFGEGNGSETYAPETLAVLRDIDFTNVNEDFDSFLGMDAAISAKELKNFSLDDPRPPMLEVPKAQTDIFGAAANSYVTPEQAGARGASALREKMAAAGKVLATFKASAAMLRNDDLALFGGEANEVKTRLGWGEAPPSYGAAVDAMARGEEPGKYKTNLHSAFQETFAALLNKEYSPGLVWDARMSDLNKPGEKQKLMQYLKTMGSTLGDTADKGFRNQSEYNKLLGFDETGDSDDS